MQCVMAEVNESKQGNLQEPPSGSGGHGESVRQGFWPCWRFRYFTEELPISCYALGTGLGAREVAVSWDCAITQLNA